MNNSSPFDTFTKFCKLAASDNCTFETFKRHPDYLPILEHLTPELGRQYLDVIEERNPQLIQHIEKFRENDKFGSPITSEYPEIGTISPTTLRYIKVLSDMIEMFDTLQNETIIEVGGGYGGQCKVISSIFNFKDYTILDLPGVAALINRYLQANNLTNAKAMTLTELQPVESWGLFISNYALTELPKIVQQEYITRVANKCAHGYITCNFISNEHGVDSMSKEEFVESIKHKCIIIEEFPQTHPKNCLLVW